MNLENNTSTNTSNDGPANVEIPKISLPKGGGAIKGIDEKFQVNAVTGTAGLSVSLPFSSSRGGAPSLGISYNSGAGNSPYGLGWQLSLPSVRRKTEKQLPRYKDSIESDTFIISDSEDLVPYLVDNGAGLERLVEEKSVNGTTYEVKRYRPRLEGNFVRIEKWQNKSNGDTHWKTVTPGNVHTFYGETAESRITDPEDNSRVFEWKITRSYTDKGHVTLYKYKAEDFDDVPMSSFEKNKINRCTQTYIKEILYGNKSAWYEGDPELQTTDFMFRAVWDYGEHGDVNNILQNVDQETKTWGCRKDPFSTFRPGFEIRTYRRCERILMFHQFEELPHSPYLTKSLQLFYEEKMALTSVNENIEGFSYLITTRQNGHLWDSNTNTYSTEYLPELKCRYQPLEWNTDIEQASSETLRHWPSGLADNKYAWTDLYGEGLSGILTEQAGAWYYKSNLGDGTFSNAAELQETPVSKGLNDRIVTLTEIEGNGQKYLVHNGEELSGFYEMDDTKWQNYRDFKNNSNAAIDANTRFLDLNGDGRPDTLRSENDSMTWMASLGEEGFSVTMRVAKAIDEEKGPTVIFDEVHQTVFLSDMSGDGLTDIVRIRNGEICYWPNLGYGYFGRKVTMGNAPQFDTPKRSTAVLSDWPILMDPELPMLFISARMTSGSG